jgi:hypothetical protein
MEGDQALAANSWLSASAPGLGLFSRNGKLAGCCFSLAVALAQPYPRFDA